MSFNQYMHPRNIYRVRPNFKSLSERYPEFKEYVKVDSNGTYSVDYKNPAALRALTQVCLRHDFNLDVLIPENKLVPTLPSRLNYILWIEDLLGVIKEDEKLNVCGIDIGTGACCIYALLGCRKNGWKFSTTEVDKCSAKSARFNIEKNHFKDKIKVYETNPNEAVFPSEIFQGNDKFHFCMCNPPFYESEAEMENNNNNRTEPSSVNTGSSHETITEGGEVKFVKRIISESIDLKEKILIYTSLLGKKSSVKQLKEDLVSNKVASCTVTTFCQGNTMRWGIAWTFNENLKLDQLQVSTHKKKTKTPKPPLVHQIYHDDTIKELLQKILAIIAKLEMHYKILKKSSTFMLLKVFAEKNTWSHQRRKRREKRKREDVDTKIPEEQVKNASRSIDEEKNKHKLSDIESGSSSLPDKRIKLDDAISFDGELYCECVLECTLTIRMSEQLGTRLELQWVNGSLGRDAMHQFLQFIKNAI